MSVRKSGDHGSKYWSQHRGDAQNTGWSNQYSGPDKPKVKWVLETGSRFSSPPSISPVGTIHVSAGESIIRVDREGNRKPSFSMWDKPSSQPTIDSDGTLYVGSFGKYVYAIKEGAGRDGTEKWSFKTAGTSHCPPKIGPDGTVYTAHRKGSAIFSMATFYAIGRGGQQKWTWSGGRDKKAHHSPAIGYNGTIYFGCGRHLIATHPDGKKKWAYSMGDWAPLSPAIGKDDTVFVGSRDGYLCAITPEGDLKWNFSIPLVRNLPAIGPQERVYASSEWGTLYAIDAEKGEELWSIETGRGTTSPTVDSNGIIYVGNNSGELYAIRPDGTQKWTFEFGSKLEVSHAPVIGPQNMYVVADDGNLYALSN